MSRARAPWIVMLLLVLAAPSCREPEEAPPATNEASGVPEGLRPGRHVFTTSDGNAMPYVVTGDGPVNVVMVHCWMCDRSFFDAQVPALQGRYRVLALDLPGHGEAGATRESWTVEAYGHDVAGLLEDLELRDVILVGHSMGGPVSLKAAALAGDRVRGIVAVDTLHDAEFSFEGPGVQQMVQAFETDFRGTCASMVEQMFVEDGVQEIVERVRRIGCEEGNVEAGQALIRDFASIDFPAWFREAGVPIRAINATAPNETKLEINQKYADFDVVLMEGVGHYLQMTRPDEFNRHLLDALEELAP